MKGAATMKNSVLVMLAALLLFSFSTALAQEEMTKEQWQQEIQKYTAQRDQLNGDLKKLESDINSLKSQSAKLDDDYQKCMDELYALVGADASKAAAYRAEIEAAENKANELMRLSDADLLAREKEVDDLEATVKNLWGNKLSLIPEFWDRLTALNEKVKSLRATISNQVKTYTVGTWRRDRDCLWNISKKKEIYDNAWLWPKIWQGNRDQIKNPDIITPGQKLVIPKGNELTSEEKAAARKYYARKAAAMAPAVAPAAK
jgi:nucleoid-associated protein YgaU